MPTTASPSIVFPRRKRFVRETPEPFQLTERDVTLVDLIAEHRFLRSTHLSELVEAPHKKVCDRLTSLFHAGYLDRPRAQLEFFRQDGGSTPMVYALANRGAQLLVAHHGPDVSAVDWARKNDHAGRPFIQHTLAIADLRVALKRAVRARPGFQILEPEQLIAMAPPETRARKRPWTWRTRVHHNDATIEIGLAPDHAFAIQYPDGRFRAFLVECDRGTMPVLRNNRKQTSVQRKFLAYYHAYRLGVHKERYGIGNFRVLTVTTSPQRIATMIEAVKDLSGGSGSNLFLFADAAALAAAPDVLAFEWLSGKGEPVHLID